MLAGLRGNNTSAGDAGWQISAPTGTTFSSVTLYRRLEVNAARYAYVARGTAAAAGNDDLFENCVNPAGCADEIARTSFARTFARGDITRLRVSVSCVPATDAPCQAVTSTYAAAVRISRADIALNDTTAPTVSSGPSSAMFAGGGPVSGVQSIAVSFADTGGGIASTGLQVDGRTVSETPVPNSTCRTPYRQVVPCPRSISATMQFNPATVPDGPHQIRVFARDATGANVGYSQTFTVTTSARGTVNGTNGSDQVKLSVGVRRAVKRGRRAGRARSAMTVAYNSKTVAEGRLVNSAGQPVIGARLAVATAVDRGVPAYADLPANVITDSQGRYKVTLPRDASRRVRVLYYARALDTAPVARDDARVKVTAHATFAPRHRRVRHGQRAVFRGHIVGAFRPPGIRVELQGRRGRHTYVTLSSAAARGDGTYRVSYRFTGSAHGRFVFRLRIRHFPRFPYFLGYTHPVNVFVR